MGNTKTEKSFSEWVQHCDFVKNKNLIPPITDPLGKYWEQPEIRAITILNDEECTMNQKAFDKLKDYSFSQPSGAYPGKMWKAKRMKAGVNTHGRTSMTQLKPEELEWYLCYFSYHEDPNFVSNNYRRITIVP